MRSGEGRKEACVQRESFSREKGRSSDGCCGEGEQHQLPLGWERRP